MNRSTFNDGFYFSTSFQDHGRIHSDPSPPHGFRGRADCGPTRYAGCGIITSTRPEVLRSQTLKAYIYCVYGKSDRRLDEQGYFNRLLQLTSRGQHC